MKPSDYYKASGDFGEVVHGAFYPDTYKNISGFDRVCSCGWHSVNSMYRIEREAGLDNHLIIFTVSGKGSARILEHSYELTPQTLLIIPPHLSCCYKTEANCTWDFYWIHSSGLNAENILTSLTAENKYLREISDSDVGDLMKQIISPKCKKSEKALYAAKILSKLFFRILEFDEAVGRKNTAVKNDIIDDLIEKLEDSFNMPINLSALAKSYYVSETHLIRLFKEKTGVTPYRYHRRQRLHKATQMLLYTDLTLTEIAMSCGYSVATSFSIQFTKEFSVCPSEYRICNRVY